MDIDPLHWLEMVHQPPESVPHTFSMGIPVPLTVQAQ